MKVGVAASDMDKLRHDFKAELTKIRAIYNFLEPQLKENSRVSANVNPDHLEAMSNSLVELQARWLRIVDSYRLGRIA